MATTHYTNFGLNQPPALADREGYIVYREGYESLPTDEWTLPEIWMAQQSLRVSVQNGSVDEFDAIDELARLQGIEQAYWDRLPAFDR